MSVKMSTPPSFSSSSIDSGTQQIVANALKDWTCANSSVSVRLISNKARMQPSC
ncbi:hypothetical protein DPMN_109169 [Dreissena polymorpha]|uniref:Uncharacterized protein n=1 Tax=Dreissena polymorpha TaxID=45954 RepID=A0A9D4K9T8_DREPO|nr:hypothetical protein DPMN_109169 [Dreissena polymorpha]